MTDGPVDVAVVGAGPVGLVLAVLLGQRGRTVTVLEQWPEPYPLPRAVHFDHEVGRILQACGIGAEVRAVSEPAEVYEWRNGRGTTLLRFGRIGVAASGWPFSSMFCQPDVERILRERVDALPTVTVRRGTRVDGIEQHDDGVTVTHTEGRLRAGYVVGCDGAGSTVRELLGVPVDDRGFHHDWLIVDLVLAEPRVFDPINVQVCDPERPTTAVSGGPGRRRWEFMRLPHETLADLGTVERAWELLAPWDVHPGNATLERHAVYTFQARVAERWQVGRALLAGDAAHLMPPFAGQGLCAGLRDAANLAWKLDLVLDGRADPALLATYDEERRPSATAAVDLSIELGKVICVPDPVEAAARDEAMAGAWDGGVAEAPGLPGITAGVVRAGDPLAGTLLPQADLGGRLFDDVHGAGWRLVTVADAPLDPDLAAWFATIGGTVVPTPELGDWFARHDVACALQRPDFHLFGTATDADGTDAMLADLRRQIRSTP
jgi:2-polyprenyl-6-methoxyphenol hydroxylase-like FAD-dependent oxidoreductase